ncbi:beta-N-acetylhexosaminidase [Hymenobacter sp. DG25B]|uniref:beta-N-acetylhexosaminidase n=1 Tax=Hymenobacter sp. DG25B TaxID=1385664 RepID=UPI0006627266|nr:family 20 glycosylhydrolase [Hymenobacter sp. DG25B]
MLLRLRFFALSLLFLFPAVILLAQPTTATRNLMPVPAELKWGKGRFVVKQHWRVLLPSAPADSAVTAAVQHFNFWLIERTGRPSLAFAQSQPTQPTELSIRYGRSGKVLLGEDESYTLRVTPIGVVLEAPTSLGILRGLATLQQLLTVEKKSFYFPEADIHDRPRFAWRGLLIDAARHFMPVPVLKRNLDAMAAVKLNVLHWHLTDDQAFRVESRVFPRLHQAGSTTPGFYTRAQIKEVLDYAAARGIRVIPEFDVPSHATSWLVAYPRLASIDTVYTPYQSFRTSNIALDPTRETTYTFIDSLFAEMTQLFPDPYFHIGGDENDGRQWRRNPRIAQYMRAQGMLTPKGLPDKHQLQTQFNRRVLTIVQKYNKKMIGWDEILGPGLPPDAVIQSWRGKKGLYDAVKEGHPALLSNGYYLDLNYSAASHYLTDPLPVDAPLTEAQKKLILGGEATMWSEFADAHIIDSRIWPRAAAVAERLWSASTVTDVPDMYRRLAAVSAQLETLGLQHRQAPEQILQQLAGSPDVTALRTLAEVLEPVKEYKRHFQGFTYTPQTPLNRLVDAAPAESEKARMFGVQVDSLLALVKANQGKLPRTPSARRVFNGLRSQLQTWQLNEVRVQPLLQTSPSLREYAPLSTHLAQVASIGLARLAQLEKGQQPPAGWLAPLQKQLDAAKAPAGQTELVVVDPIKRLLSQ